MAPDARPGLSALYPALLAGEVDIVRRLFPARPQLALPQGTADSEATLGPLTAELTRLWSDLDAHVEPGRTFHGPDRDVHELTVWITVDGDYRDLPVVLVGDRTRDGFAAIRGYHSSWPVDGTHRVQHPVLPPDPTIRLTEPFATYHRGLTAGDPDQIAGTLAPGAWLREPAGRRWRHGGEDLAVFFARLKGAGVGLRLLTYTDTPQAQVMEYVCDRVGTQAVPPTAGGAVYELDERRRIVAARVYDNAARDAR